MDLLFTAWSIKRFFYLALVASISCVFYVEQHHAQYYSQCYWLIWSVFLLSLMVLPGLFFNQFAFVALTGLAVALTTALSSCLSGFTPLLVIYLCLLTMVLTFISGRYREYALSMMTINALAVLAAFLPASFIVVGARTIFIIMGTVLVVVFQFLFSFRLVRAQLRFNVVCSLCSFRLLSKEIFSSLLNSGHADLIYPLERRIHVQKNNFMRAMGRLQNRARYMENKKSEKIMGFLRELNLLYDMLLNCAQIRWRVSDHTSFEICKQELILVAREIDKASTQVIKNFKSSWFLSKQSPIIDLHGLNQAFYRLEENYQHVLQVAASDPLVFFLFMDGLKVFISQMHKLNQLASEVSF